MGWVHKENLGEPDLRRSRSGHVVGVANDPERAQVVVAIQTGNGDLVALRLTPLQCVGLKLDLYNAIELNKRSQVDIETYIAAIEGATGSEECAS